MAFTEKKKSKVAAYPKRKTIYLTQIRKGGGWGYSRVIYTWWRVSNFDKEYNNRVIEYIKTPRIFFLIRNGRSYQKRVFMANVLSIMDHEPNRGIF